MQRSSKWGLFLIGAGAGGLFATYVVLRRNREKIDRAARATREVADQADRIARTLEGVRKALGPRPEQGETDEADEGRNP